ncbi:MAG: MBL fold metallo-hydrolase [Eubacteriales bacterium]|nr:MBL fold metallo-hydrolase [Eubacteriales bacterium]
MRNIYEKKRLKVIWIMMAVIALMFIAVGYVFGQSRCTVTQYGDISGNQGQFYVIRNPQGLILVDGGWAANEEQVRSVLKKNGNHVSAWILTHPHPDHMGAFNEIWQNPDGIEIDEVYTINLDYELYKKYAREWDEFDIFDTFVNITAGDERIHYLYAGDELELIGLQMKVLHAYDDEVPKLSKDLANDGSMMFRLTNEKESFLFCADVGKKMSKRIRKMYGEFLKCDYIQMGHHGNGGLSAKFYRQTQPKAAFFDAPPWLMHPQDESLGYTTPENADLMESMGAKIYDYQTAPNEIVLK